MSFTTMPVAEAPSGLPPEQDKESEPLGVPDADPEGEDANGTETMPGIPTEGEPPTSG
ncbi:MAG TPA: hypothetical protein VD931_22860 [Baekduia sp.]|nr:hypothetical protein [Baekduia sp.]